MKTLINIKTDKETKEQAQKLAQDLGLTLSALVTAQLKQAIRTKSVHLTTYKPTPYLEKRLEQVDRDIKLGKNISPAFDSADEMFEYLDKK